MVIYTVYRIWLYSYRYLRAINFKIITIIIIIIIIIKIIDQKLFLKT